MPRKKIPYQNILLEFKEAHGDIYDYSKVIYKGSITPITILCSIHGDFKQTPSEHKRGSGCQKCANMSRSVKCFKNKGTPYNLKTTEKYIKECKEIHGDKYDYRNIVYLNNGENVIIICKEHGEFEQRASHHLSGHGCPECSFTIKEHNGYGYKNGIIIYYPKPTQVYFLHIKDNIYKIGITTKQVQERIDELNYPNIKVIRTKQFSTGKQAYLYEQRLLKKYKRYCYTGKSIIASGNTELINLKKKKGDSDETTEFE